MPDASRRLEITDRRPLAEPRQTVRVAELEQWRERLRTVEVLAGWSSGEFTVRGLGVPEAVRAAMVTPDFFEVFNPRGHRADRPAGPLATDVVVMSSTMANRTRGGGLDPRTARLTLGTASFGVGVIAPAAFTVPEDADLWVHAGAGALGGLALAWYGVAALQPLMADALPRLAVVALGWPALIVGAGLTVTVTVLAGTGPAVAAARSDFGPAFRGVTATASPAARRTRAVESAGVGSSLPPSTAQIAFSVRVVNGDTVSTRPFDVGSASPGYFEAIGARLVRGRGFEPRDLAGGPVAVLSETAALHLQGLGDPVGRPLAFSVPAPSGERVTPLIIGIVADVRHHGLETPANGSIYLRRSELPTAFALVAVALAVAGLVGALSRTVTERRREVAIRAVLGATPRSAMARVLIDGAVLAVAGLAIGFAASAAMGRSIATLLYGVSPFDPWTFGGVAGAIGLVVALAAWLPARRAARVQPLELLRAE